MATKCHEIRDLESLLRISFGSELTLVNYSIGNLVTVGENFRSCVLKLTARVRRTNDSPCEDLEFVVKKTSSDVLEIIKNIDTNRLFEKEIFMYTNILELYRKIEMERGFCANAGVTNYFPKFYGSRMEDGDIFIILENLKANNYYSVDVQIGMDLEHTTKALKMLSRFHAIGIAVKCQYPIEFKLIASKYDKPEYDYEAVNVVTSRIVDIIRNDPRLERYASRVEKITSLIKNGWKKEWVMHEPWISIIHYDFWSNNMMFHRDDVGNVDDLKLLDFQTYFVSDIFCDLVYFIFTSTNDCVKLTQLDQVLNAYYDNLILYLKKLGVDVELYSRQQFHDGLKLIAPYDLFHCYLVLNLILTKELSDDSLKLESNDIYFKKVSQLLRIFEEKNWFPEN